MPKLDPPQVRVRPREKLCLKPEHLAAAPDENGLCMECRGRRLSFQPDDEDLDFPGDKPMSTKADTSPYSQDSLRRFVLQRIEDETGVSGTGIVAEGVKFEDGRCVVRWRGTHSSIVIWESLDDVIAIHGHNGKTQLNWID